MAEVAGSPPRFQVATDQARKLFIGDDRLGIATYGLAEIEGRAIEDLISEFRDAAAETVLSAAQSLGEWFARKMNEAARPRRGDLVTADGLRWPLGFIVTGLEDGVGRLYEVRVRSGDSRVSRLAPSTENPGVYAFGLTDGIDRLLTGVDLKALRMAGISLDPEEREKLDVLAYDLKVPEGLSEAVDLAADLVAVQLLAQRSSWGAYASKESRIEGCGGPLQAVTVSAEGARLARPNSATSSPTPPAASVPADEAQRPFRQSGSQN